MQSRHRWSDDRLPERCPECGARNVAGDPHHRTDCRYFLTEEELHEEPVTLEEWKRPPLWVFGNTDPFLRSPAAA